MFMHVVTPSPARRSLKRTALSFAVIHLACLCLAIPSSGGGKWGAPPADVYGEQPGFDYPYDNASSTKCYVTGNGTDPDAVPANTSWQLTSGTFDLSGADAAVIDYALWFFVRTGDEDDEFTVEFGNDSDGWTTLQTVTTYEYDSPYWGQRVRWVRQRVAVPLGAGNFTTGRQLRFTETRVLGSSGVVESCVDDVHVWRVFAH